MFALLVALARRLRHEHAEGALRLTGFRGPVQPVALAGSTRNPLRVRENAIAGTVLRRVFLFRIDDRLQYLDRGELVAPDAPGEQFFLSRRGVESPLVPALHQRKGKREIVVSDRQRCLAAVANDGVLLFVVRQEALQPSPGPQWRRPTKAILRRYQALQASRCGRGP